MILNVSQLSLFQYRNCDNCKIVLWWATVYFTIFIVKLWEAKQGLLQIVWNVIILRKADIKNPIFFSENLRHLCLVLQQLQLIKIETIVVGVETTVVFLQQLWLVATIVNIATIVITNQWTIILKTDIIIHFMLNCLIWSYYELNFCV